MAKDSKKNKKDKVSDKKKSDGKVIKMQKKAIKDYAQHLIDQIEWSSKKDIKKQYRKYVLNQISTDTKGKVKEAKKIAEAKNKKK